ncbi:alpha/beta hydrolase fold domain-containing protein [Streptomyces sp. 021-4]|uniref:alpha/beta hydrolase fold domain-containing protein n=1 Tax=Streptomyces sp. 021-4 TaxID=2789260 RepID=UPI0039F5F491
MHVDPVDITWQAGHVPALTHAIPVRVYRPEPDRYGWLVWAPGGSWQAASVELWHDVSTALAQASRCTVVTPSYLLAPRHRHPAQLNDVLRVLDWAREQAVREGEPPVTAVGGDSAGGTLAAAAALVLRDRGEALAAQVLAYPPLDPSCTGRSYARLPDAFPSARRMRAAWQAYLGPGRLREGEQGADGSRLYATPLEAGRFDGLAPLIAAVGELDPVADDVTGYAGRLREAGNRMSFRTFPATAHAAVLGDDPPPGGGLPMRQWLGSELRAVLAAARRPSAAEPGQQTDQGN